MTINIEPDQQIRFSEIVHISEGTRPSINLARDKDDTKKVEGYIPTPTAIELLTQLAAAVSGSNTNGRVRYLYGPYGGGKSHLSLILQYLVRFGPESLAMAPIWTKLRGMGQNGQLLIQSIFDTWNKLDGNKGFFLVILQANDGPFRQAMLSALNRAVVKVFKEEAWQVQSSSIYQAALEQLDLWRNEHPDLYNKVKQETDVETLKSGLSGFKHEAYVHFCEAYAKVTGGGSFDPGSWARTFEVYAEVASKLRQYGYQGIYIIHDEFGDYLNQAIRDDVEGYQVVGPRSRGDGIEFQEFAEMCVESGDAQVHFLMCSHLDIAGYADRTRADKDVKEAWQKYYGRASQTLITSLGGDKEVFQLIDGVIVQEHDHWQAFVENGAQARLLQVSRDARKHEFFPAKDWELNKIEQVVVHGCYPLHPVTLYALPRLSVLLGQNERTMFTFVSGTDTGTLGAYMREHPAFLPRLAPMFPMDYLFDYFEPSLKTNLKDWYSRAAYLAGGASAPSLDMRLLKVLTLWQVMLAGTVLPLTQNRAAFALDLLPEGYEELEQSVKRLQEKELVYVSRDETIHVYGDKSNLENEIKEKIDLLRPNHRPGDFLRRKNGQLMSPTLRIDDVYPVAYTRDFGVIRGFKAEYFAPGDFQQQILRGKRGINPWQQVLAPLKDETDGLILYALPQSRQERDAVINAVIGNGHLVHPRVIIVVPTHDLSLFEHTLKLDALLTMLLETESSNTERRNILLKKQSDVVEELETLLHSLLQFIEGSRGAEIYCGGERLNPSFNSPADLEDCIDQVLRQTFKFEVAVKDESFAQRRAAPGTSKVQKNIIREILKFEALSESDRESFGYSDTSAERRVIRSVLRAHDILKIQGGKWLLSTPTNDIEKNLAVIMSRIAGFFFSQDGERKPVKDLIKPLLEPPYGVFETVLPIYIAAAIHKQARQLTFYYKNAQAKSDLTTIIQDLTDDYEFYEVSWHGVKPEDRALMQVIIQTLDVNVAQEELSPDIIIEQLTRSFNNLPVLTRETQHLPNEVLNFRNLLKEVALGQVASEEVLNRFARVLNYSELVNSSGGQVSRLIPLKEKLQNYFIHFNRIAIIQQQKLSELLSQKIKELPDIDVDDENLTLALDKYLETRDPQDISRYTTQFSVIKQVKGAASHSSSIDSVVGILAKSWFNKPILEWNDPLIERFQDQLNNLFQILSLMHPKPERGVKEDTTIYNPGNNEDGPAIDPPTPPPVTPMLMDKPYLKHQFIRAVLQSLNSSDVSRHELEPSKVKEELAKYYSRLPEYVKNTNRLPLELNNLKAICQQAANDSTSSSQILSKLWTYFDLPRNVAEEYFSSSLISRVTDKLTNQFDSLDKSVNRLTDDANKVLYEALLQVLRKEPDGGVNRVVTEIAGFFQGRDPAMLTQVFNLNLTGMSEVYQASQNEETFSALATNLQVLFTGKSVADWTDENFQQYKGKVQSLIGNLKNIPEKPTTNPDTVKLTLGIDNDLAYYEASPFKLTREQEVAFGTELLTLLRKYKLANDKGLHLLIKIVLAFIRGLEKKKR